MRPIIYSDQEIQLINNKLNSLTFSADSWSDDDISLLKTRIKTYYISEQNNKCPYCKKIIPSNNHRLWDIEHIISRVDAEKFMFEAENLCAACIDCNGAKSNKKVTTSRAQIRLPRRSDQYLIIHPHFDDYNSHILVVKVCMYYIALDEKGKKTIEICGLNRFYQFSTYDPAVENDDRIRMLSNRLCENNVSENEKVVLRNEIASIAIGINSNT